MAMYRVRIKEGEMERYWSRKNPIEFDPLDAPLYFSSEKEARAAIKCHLPLFARYIELSDQPITDLVIVKTEEDGNEEIIVF